MKNSSLRQRCEMMTVTSGKSKAARTVYLAVSKKDVPRGIKRYHVHPPAEIPPCNTCHDTKGKSATYKRIIPTRANCTTGKCHPEIGTGEVLHGPIGAKVCVFCHNPHGSLLPKEISRAGADLCISCHHYDNKLLSELLFLLAESFL